MLHRKLTGFLVGILVVGFAAGALANIPDLDNSFAEVGPAGASVWNLPNGFGRGFDQAGDGSGGTVDATITLFLRDANDDPIVGYPFEDLWLETSGGGLVACPGGTTADLNTDDQGMTEWQNTMFAGGHSEGETVNVYVAGSPLNHPGLNVLFNSADIDGNLIVNLADLTEFAIDYDGQTGAYRSDYLYDGTINLSDVTLFAQGYQTSCP